MKITSKIRQALDYPGPFAWKIYRDAWRSRQARKARKQAA